jgi:hypothetical protein
VRLDVPVGRSVPTQLDPNFSTAANEMVIGSSLYFWHSGSGCLGVIIPFDNLAALHGLFGAQIEETKVVRARPLCKVCLQAAPVEVGASLKQR